MPTQGHANTNMYDASNNTKHENTNMYDATNTKEDLDYHLHLTKENRGAMSLPSRCRPETPLEKRKGCQAGMRWSEMEHKFTNSTIVRLIFIDLIYFAKVGRH
jgi:hypothetical protein